MDCEVCGKKIIGPQIRAVISGAKLVVCGRCARLSNETWTPQIKILSPNEGDSAPQVVVKRRKEMRQPVELEMVDGYGALIREARRGLGLNHEDLGKAINEKVSVLQKIETEKMVPDQRLAKKLEHSLKVKLLVLPEARKLESSTTATPFELTLGDIVTLKRKGGEGKDQ